MEHIDGQHIAKAAGDIGSASILLGTWVNTLPSIASALTIVWVLTRLYEYGKEKVTANKKQKEPNT